jgi:hypothetical protein
MARIRLGAYYKHCSFEFMAAVRRNSDFLSWWNCVTEFLPGIFWVGTNQVVKPLFHIQQDIPLIVDEHLL